MRRSPLAIGLLAVTLAFAFQALTVRYNYGGDWTALFWTGARWTQPAELPTPYQFQNSWGYDGQFYRLIAHDPLLRRGFAEYIDDPQYRYTRILVPGLACVLALGDDRFIDYAYIAVILGFIFAGSAWLTMLAKQRNWPPLTGLLFLLTPATLVGIDRLTIDVALAAFCVAFVALKPGSAKWYAMLACAALSRETGLLLIVAAFITTVRERRWRDTVATASTAVPVALWTVWVITRATLNPVHRLSLIPLSGFVTRLTHPSHYSLSPLIAATTEALDYGTLAGVAIALWCLWRLRTQWTARPELLTSALPVLFVNLPDVWTVAHAFGRTMTPFWLLIAIRGAESGIWLTIVPIALIDLRIIWQLGPQLMGILRGLVT